MAASAPQYPPAQQEMDSSQVLIDLGRQRFPYSVVWGPLGPLTCCCPCVGHLGIADSQGKIHDFNGSRSIGVDRFMVGTVWRYAVVGSPAEAAQWDAAIARADAEYKQHNHDICCDNCHHHAALALTEFGRPHSLLSIWFLCCLHGRCTCCSCK
eukprot:TRINITY_DN13982_c0_g1_i1.p1 TRINITY_DN13982_c0_g1~~TRINITY_DN13982_c0_g1_i1.p1  ORF type:complete len:162 (+),score=16.30 TRINITY_DN13982_c0_g1_i1:25-486(+)